MKIIYNKIQKTIKNRKKKNVNLTKNVQDLIFAN